MASLHKAVKGYNLKHWNTVVYIDSLIYKTAGRVSSYIFLARDFENSPEDKVRLITSKFKVHSFRNSGHVGMRLRFYFPFFDNSPLYLSLAELLATIRHCKC